MRSFNGNFKVKVLLLLSVVAWTRLAFAQPPDPTPLEEATRVLEKMRAEKIPASKAWADGLMTKSVLLYALGEDQLLDSGRGLWNPANETYEWAQLLVDELPELLDQPAALNDAARVRVALFFLTKRDARGARMMEKIIDAMPRDRPDTQVLNAAIYNLSNYYRAIGQNDKALATSLKIQEFQTDSTTLANLLLGAARAAYASGDKAGAARLYDQVIGYGYGWTTGHVYSDQARHLFAEGKLEEGRALLKKPIEGLNADQIRVVLDHQLAQSYYETGEWEEARRYAKAAVDQYNSLGNPIKNHGLEWIVQSAKELPQQIAQWEKKPVQLYPQKIVISTSAGNTEEPIRTYFNVNSYRAITVKAVSSNPEVKVWPLQSPYGYESRNMRMIGVEAPAAALKEDLKAEIVVTIEEFPEVTLRVPIALRNDGAPGE